MNDSFRQRLAHSWFFPALILAFVIGWCWPALGAGMRETGVTPWLVALAFFLNGLTLSPTALAGSLRQWRVLVIAALLIFAVAPAIIFVVRCVVPGGHAPLALGFQMLAVVPTMLVSAVVITRMAGGNGATALYLTVTGNLLAILLMPPLLHLTLGVSGVHLPVWHTTLDLVETVLLPTAVGQLCRRRWDRAVTRRAPAIGTISQSTILIFIIIGLAYLPHGGVSTIAWGIAIAGSLVYHAILLVLGDVAGRAIRLDRPTRRALTFCTSEKSLVVALLLFERIFVPLGPAYGIAAMPAILYYVIELFMDSLLARWWGNKSSVLGPLSSVNSSE